MNCPYQNKNKKTTECGRNHIHGKRKSKIGSIGGITDELYSDHKRKILTRNISAAPCPASRVLQKWELLVCNENLSELLCIWK